MATEAGRPDPTTRLGPEVVLDVERRGPFWLLVLANTGDSTAYRPRVSFSHPLVGLGGRHDIVALPIWQRLALLRPGHQVDIVLDSQAAGSCPRRVEATVTWETATGDRAERRLEHDLGAYDGLPTPP